MKQRNNDRFKQFEDYVNIKVPVELRNKIKSAAAQKNKTIIKYLEEDKRL